MKPKMTTLKNGMRIVTIPMKDNPTVTIMAMVEAGSRFETKSNNGLSHFLEHMCFKGTLKRKSLDIAYELEAMGAETNAFTSNDYTGYYVKGQAHLFPQLLDVVSDVYLHSQFPEAEIEKERGVILGEIDMYEDMPHRKVHDVANELLYGDQPAGYLIIGPKENIKKFTRDDFVAYHKAHYVAPKTTIVIAGNIDEAASITLTKKLFQDIADGKRVEKKKMTTQTGDRTKVFTKKTDQSHIIVGLRSIPVDHPDMTALSLAIGILGQGMSSRLFTKLREEMGAGYYVRSSISASNDGGDIAFSTGTEPKRVPEVTQAILNELEKMRTITVSDQELRKQKQYTVGTLLMSLETSDALAGHYAYYAMMRTPLKTPEQQIKEIKAVSPADISRVARKYLKESLVHIAVVGPNKSSDIEIL